RLHRECAEPLRSLPPARTPLTVRGRRPGIAEGLSFSLLRPPPLRLPRAGAPGSSSLPPQASGVDPTVLLSRPGCSRTHGVDLERPRSASAFPPPPRLR